MLLRLVYFLRRVLVLVWRENLPFFALRGMTAHRRLRHKGGEDGFHRRRRRWCISIPRYVVREVGNQLGDLVQQVGGSVNFGGDLAALNRQGFVDSEASTNQNELTGDESEKADGLESVEHESSNVEPYLKQWGPPEFSATFPPIVQAAWLEGSGA